MKPDFAALMQQCHTPPETWDIAEYTRLVLEEAAKVCWELSDDLSHRDDMLSEQGMAQRCATVIRSIKP